MVGNGVLENELKILSKSDDRICFLPFQNQSIMPAIYRLGDLFVLPSLSETWGLSVNEAMACGRAILVSDKCGCAEDLVSSGENGEIFKSDSEVDLIAKMNMLVASKNKLRKMGLNSQKKIETWNFGHQVLAIKNILA